jgi:hypothetical protein
MSRKMFCCFCKSNNGDSARTALHGLVQSPTAGVSKLFIDGPENKHFRLRGPKIRDIIKGIYKITTKKSAPTY